MKGNIKHSVVFWCFNVGGENWSIDRTCEVAKSLGCQSVEICGPEEWPTIRKHGLKCAIAANGMPGAPFMKGLNNPAYQDQVISVTSKTIDECAAAGVPNVIAFTGYKWKDAEDPALRFAAALSGSDLATASKLMKDEQLDQPEAAMQLYIAATCGRNTLVQSTALQVALDALRAGDVDQRLFATYLDGSVKPTRKQLVEFSSTPAFKAVGLTAIGCRWPALRQDAFGLSYSFDYGLRYPHGLLKRARATVKE